MWQICTSCTWYISLPLCVHFPTSTDPKLYVPSLSFLLNLQPFPVSMFSWGLLTQQSWWCWLLPECSKRSFLHQGYKFQRENSLVVLLAAISVYISSPKSLSVFLQPLHLKLDAFTYDALREIYELLCCWRQKILGEFVQQWGACYEVWAKILYHSKISVEAMEFLISLFPDLHILFFSMILLGEACVSLYDSAFESRI